jgi:hypothetical protein
MLPNYSNDPLKFYDVLKSLTPDQLTKEWQPVSEEQYQEMRDVLPPIRYSNNCFLVGEPMTHTDQGVIYEAFVKIDDRHYKRPAYLHTFSPDNYRQEIAGLQ